VQQRLVRPRVELKKDVAFLNQCPFLEIDLLQVAPDVRPDLDGIDRGRAGRVVRVVRDPPLGGITDYDRDRCCLGRFRGRPRAARQAETESKDQRGTAECCKVTHQDLPLLVKKAGSSGSRHSRPNFLTVSLNTRQSSNSASSPE